MCHGVVFALRHLRCAKGKEDRDLAGAEGCAGGWANWKLGTGNWGVHDVKMELYRFAESMGLGTEA